jgi:hypothetical protein
MNGRRTNDPQSVEIGQKCGSPVRLIHLRKEGTFHNFGVGEPKRVRGAIANRAQDSILPHMN